MKRFFSLLFVGFLALVLSISSVYAAAKKAKPTPPPRHTVIASISADSITVDTGLTTRTYKIDHSTAFSFQGNTVSASAIKAGMRVTVTPGGLDGQTAAAVEAADAPKVVESSTKK